MNYTIGIEPDNEKRGAKMVVIRNAQGEIRKIPARGLTYDQAVSVLDPIRYAAEFGLSEAAFQCARMRFDLKEVESK
jgi:hypothetical protein